MSNLVLCPHRGATGSVSALLVGAALLASGCSILNPHVTPRGGRPPANVTLPAAVDYANRVRDAYYCAVGDQSLLRNGVALSAIPMAAAALGLGITGGSTEAITALGLGGASAFGIGTFLYSDARQRVYLTGSQAVGCAILAMTPLMIPDDQVKEFKQHLDALGPSAEAVHEQIAIVQALAAPLQDRPGLPSVQAAKVAVARANDVLSRADKALSAGGLLKNRLDTAGITLVTTVDTIRDKVSVQVTRTEPDLQSITGIIAGLGPAVSKFAPSAPSAAAAPKTAGVGVTEARKRAADQDLQEAVVVLNAKTDVLAEHSAAVAELVNQVAAASRSVGSLEDCKVPEREASFSVTPDVDTAEIKPGQTIVFATSGGTGTPQAAIVGTKIDGLSVETPLDSRVVRVTADAKVKGPAEATLLIKDATGTQQKVITIKVPAGTAAGGGAAASPQHPVTPPQPPAAHQPGVTPPGTVGQPAPAAQTTPQPGAIQQPKPAQ